MAQTNAQRQAAYRTRHLKDENGMSERISLVVDVHTKRALERLATHYAVTQQAMLQTLIKDAEKALIDSLTATEQAIYHDRKPVTR